MSSHVEGLIPESDLPEVKLGEFDRLRIVRDGRSMNARADSWPLPTELVDRVAGVEQGVADSDARIEALELSQSSGYPSATTYADIPSAVPSPDVGNLVRVTNDPNVDRNGTWRWSGTAWEKAVEPINPLAIDVASTPEEPIAEPRTTDDLSVYPIVDEHGRALLGFDADGFQLNNLPAEFHADDSGAALAFCDEQGRVIFGIGDDGTAGLPDLSVLPVAEKDVADGVPFLRDGQLAVRRDHHPLYSMLQADAINSTDDLYLYYDGLVADFPDYVSRHQIGMDGAGAPIYAYEFSAPGVRSMQANLRPLEQTPKAVLVSGIHGNERTGMFPLILFAHELCHQWRESEQLRTLRWGCEFLIVPAMTPSALNAGPPQRKNNAGVDVNRNFPADWEEGGSTDPSSSNYRGVAAGSESETAVMMGFTDDHDDAFLFVDLHNHSSMAVNGYGLWLGVTSERGLRIAEVLNREANAWGHKEASPIYSGNQPLNRITTPPEGSMSRWWKKGRDLNGVLFESVTGGMGDRIDVIRFNTFCLKRLIELHYEEHIRATIEGAPDTYIDL